MVEHATHSGGRGRGVWCRPPPPPGAGAAEEALGRGGVRVLLEEVMLDAPRVVVAQPVRELDLGERVLERVVFASPGPGPRDLVLVEDPELHGPASLIARAAIAT